MKKEKNWNKATDKELLEEAKRRYPIGCKVKLIGHNIGGDYKNEVRFTKHSVYNYNISKRKQLFVDGNLLLFDKNKWAKIISLPETKIESKEVIPEYIEWIKPQSMYFIPGNIYKVINTDYRSSCEIISNIKCYEFPANHILYVDLTDTSSFKPSTKEAFDAQIGKESIEKWSVGSYIVPLQNKLLTRNEPLIKGKPYQIIRRGSVPYIICEKDTEINFYDNYDAETTEGIKWFATKSEAEEFAKTLIQPVKEEVKQAVYCKTIEEYKFVKEKLGAVFYQNLFNEEGSIIPLDAIDVTISLNRFESVYSNYKLLSFQEWCKLNNYNMNKKKYTIKELETNIKLLIYIDSKEEHDKIKKVSKRICPYNGNYCYSLYIESYSSTSSKSCPGAYDGDSIILTIDDIIFEDNIKSDKKILNKSSIGKYISFNYNGRFYDEAFIIKENGYIYLLNNCYSNNNGHSDKSKYKYSLKFNNFNEIKFVCKNIKFLDFEDIKVKPLQPNDLTWEIQVPQIKTHGIMWCKSTSMTKDNGKNKMILSIDDEELPMVSIIKTNTIKQLLNLE